MPDEKKETKAAPVQEAVEGVKIPYPAIPIQFWLDGEIQRIFTPETDPRIPEGKIVLELYATLLQYGVKEYMTKQAGLELGKELVRICSD